LPHNTVYLDLIDIKLFFLADDQNNTINRKWVSRKIISPKIWWLMCWPPLSCSQSKKFLDLDSKLKNLSF